MDNIQLILFFAGTLFLIFISWWISLKSKRYHGIARFFSFESILVLTLLNYPLWLKDPFSVNQIMSWGFLVLSLVYIFLALYFFFKLGKPEKEFENTTVLVTKGIYKFVRHPMYASLLFLGFGIYFKDPGMLQALFALVNLLAIIFTARIEEGEMIRRFGEEYRGYMKVSKRFIPWLM